MNHVADDNPLWEFAVTSVLLPETERRPEERSAKGTAFMLLCEGDTHVSDALEHSDKLPPPCWVESAYSTPYVSTPTL